LTKLIKFKAELLLCMVIVMAYWPGSAFGQLRHVHGQAIDRAQVHLSGGVQVAAQSSEQHTRAKRAYDRRKYKKAFEIWSPLAEQGDPVAQAYLGVMYENGQGVTPDPVIAADWYRKAADHGEPEAHLNLAVRYEKGE